MVELSARIKDQHIQKSVHQNLKKSNNTWRWIWLVVFLALLGAIVYFVYRFTLYSESKVDNLISEAHAAEQQLEFSKALDFYDQALLLKDVSKENSAQAAFYAAAIYSNKSQHEKAQEYLKIATDLQPDNLDYWSGLAHSYLQANDLGGLSDVYTTMQDVDSQDSKTLLIGAWSAIVRQQDPSSLLKQVLSQDAENSEAQYLSLILNIMEQPTRAIATLEDSLSKLSDEGQVQKYLGLKDVTEQITSIQDNSAYKLVLLGSTLLDINEPYLALYFLNQATQTDDQYRDAWVFKASAELKTNQLDQAKLSLDQAAELDPTYAFTRFLEGDLLSQQARQQDLDLKDSEIFKNAIKKYVQAIKQGYDNETSRIRLALAQADAGLIEAAATTLTDAVGQDSFDPATLYPELFWIYFDDQDYQQAVEVATEFVDNDPLLARAQGYLALAKYFAGDQQGAQTAAGQTLEADQNDAAGLLVQGLVQHDQTLILHAIDVDIDGRITKIAKQYL